MSRIETPTDFLAQVDAGLVLYILRSWHGKPTYVERVEVTRVEKVEQPGIYGAEPTLRCHFIAASGREISEHVGDMLNRWHGVWTELEEALTYMQERKAAYETDPELIEEYRESVEESKHWRKLLREAW